MAHALQLHILPPKKKLDKRENREQKIIERNVSRGNISSSFSFYCYVHRHHHHHYYDYCHHQDLKEFLCQRHFMTFATPQSEWDVMMKIFIQHSLPDLLSAHTARSLSCALTYEIIYNKYASQPQKYNFQSLRVRQLIESITDGHVVFVDAPCT